MRRDGRRWSKGGYGSWRVLGSDNPSSTKCRCREPNGVGDFAVLQLLLVSPVPCLRRRCVCYVWESLCSCQLVAKPSKDVGQVLEYIPERREGATASFTTCRRRIRRTLESNFSYSRMLSQYLNALRQPTFSIAQHTCLNHLALT